MPRCNMGWCVHSDQWWLERRLKPYRPRGGPRWQWKHSTAATVPPLKLMIPILFPLRPPTPNPRRIPLIAPRPRRTIPNTPTIPIIRSQRGSALRSASTGVGTRASSTRPVFPTPFGNIVVELSVPRSVGRVVGFGSVGAGVGSFLG